MRLIDADELEVVSLQCKSEEFCNGVMWLLEQIDKMPTVYDIDKVVEELKKVKDVARKSTFQPDLYYANGLQTAIEIVKGR